MTDQVKETILNRQKVFAVEKANLQSTKDKENQVNEPRKELGTPGQSSGLFIGNIKPTTVGRKINVPLVSIKQNQTQPLRTLNTSSQLATVANRRPVISLFPASRKDVEKQKQEQLIEATTRFAQSLEQEQRALLAQRILQGVDVTLLSPELQLVGALNSGIQSSIERNKILVQNAQTQLNQDYTYFKRQIESEIQTISNSESENNLVKEFFNAQKTALQKKLLDLEKRFNSAQQAFRDRVVALDQLAETIKDNAQKVRDLQALKLRSTSVTERNKIELGIADLNARIQNQGIEYFASIDELKTLGTKTSESLRNDFLDNAVIRDAQLDALKRIEVPVAQKPIFDLLFQNAGKLQSSVVQYFIQTIEANQSITDAKIQQLEKQLGAKNADLESLKSQFQTLQEQNKRYQEEITSLSQATDKQTEIIKDQEKKIQNKIKQIEENEKKLAEVTKAYNTLQDQFNSLNKNQQELLKQKSQVEQERDSLKITIEQRKKDIDELIAQNEILRQTQGALEGNAKVEKEALQKQIQIANNRVKELEDALANKDGLSKALEESLKNEQKLQKEKQEILLKYNNEVNTLKAELEDLQDQNRYSVKEYAQQQNKITDLQEEKAKLEKALKDLQNQAPIQNFFQDSTQNLISNIISKAKEDYANVLAIQKELKDQTQTKELQSIIDAINKLEQLSKTNPDNPELKNIGLYLNQISKLRDVEIALVGKAIAEKVNIDKFLRPELQDLFKKSRENDDLTKKLKALEQQIKSLQQDRLDTKAVLDKLSQIVDSKTLDKINSIQGLSDTQRISQIIDVLKERIQENAILREALDIQENITNLKVTKDQENKFIVSSNKNYNASELITDLLGLKEDIESTTLSKGGGPFGFVSKGLAPIPFKTSISFSSLFKLLSPAGQNIQQLFYAYFDLQDEQSPIKITVSDQTPPNAAIKVVREWRKFAMNAARFDFLYQFLRILQERIGVDKDYTITGLNDPRNNDKQNNFSQKIVTLITIFFDYIRRNNLSSEPTQKIDQSKIDEIIQDISKKADSQISKGIPAFKELGNRMIEILKDFKQDFGDTIKLLFDLWVKYNNVFELVSKVFSGNYEDLLKKVKNITDPTKDPQVIKSNITAFAGDADSYFKAIKPFMPFNINEIKNSVVKLYEIDFSITQLPSDISIQSKIGQVSKDTSYQENPFIKNPEASSDLIQDYKIAFEVVLDNLPTAPTLYKNGKFLEGYTFPLGEIKESK